MVITGSVVPPLAMLEGLWELRTPDHGGLRCQVEQRLGSGLQSLIGV
jgi:hypothetical protein